METLLYCCSHYRAFNMRHCDVSPGNIGHIQFLHTPRGAKERVECGLINTIVQEYFYWDAVIVLRKIAMMVASGINPTVTLEKQRLPMTGNLA
jgi:hypothetical protein